MSTEEALARLAERLAPYLSDPALVRAALVHRSYCAEAPGEVSNERLEFLGDSVLGLVVTEALYRENPTLPEGDLARMRATLVSTETLARLASALGVGAALLLGKGEAASGGSEKPSLLADALEALIGASFLEGGAAHAGALVTEIYGNELVAARRYLVLGDAKNRLQEMAARRQAEPPAYVLKSDGPEHAKRFVAVVTAAGVTASGEGRSKKQAERAAALAALALLGDPTGSTDA